MKRDVVMVHEEKDHETRYPVYVRSTVLYMHVCIVRYSTEMTAQYQDYSVED